MCNSSGRVVSEHEAQVDGRSGLIFSHVLFKDERLDLLTSSILRRMITVPAATE
jgi:hypothetical protein